MDAGMVNTSGMRSSVPQEIQGGWNWGGCLLGWIWCFAMRLPVWGALSLLSNLISIFFGLFNLVNFALAIVFGIKGNEWAWQNRRFESVEHFRKVQRIWMIWGIVITLFFIVFWVMIVLFVVGAVIAAQPWR
ncbi:MAG TPA: hypothetical protein VNJ09_09520 [Chthonomonadales bacterium]|nr:hypothetical protein [Chthonomonadales bacterium]